MHDVAVTFDRHHVAEFYAAVLSDSADVVAGEIDQHDVLGSLFRIGEELLFQPLVLFIGRSAFASAGEWANRDLAIFDADHDFRRTADERCVWCPQQEHERTGIHDSQRAVDVERRSFCFELQTLADDHLKDVASDDVFLALFDGGLELALCEIRLIGQLRLAGQRDVVERQVGFSGLQLLAGFIDANAGLVIRLPQIAALRACVADHQDRLLDVIEDDHAVVKRERHVGQLAVIERCVRQMLGVADDVVTGVADGSAAETGQLGMWSGSIAGDQRLEFLQRIGDLSMSDAFWLVVFTAFGQRNVVTERFQSQERICADEAVTSDLLAADDALKQERARTRLQFAESGTTGVSVSATNCR